MRPTSPYGPCANWRRIKAASAACEVVVSGPIRLNRSDQQTAVVTHVDASQLIFATNPWLPALQSSRHSCCGDSKGMRTAAAARIDDPCAKICLLGVLQQAFWTPEPVIILDEGFSWWDFLLCTAPCDGCGPGNSLNGSG